MPGLADLVHEFRPARHRPQGALVLFHGRAKSERDLLPLFDILDPERLYVGVSPRGPLTLPPSGYHWYRIPKVGFPDPESFDQTFSLLDDWLNALALAVGVPPHKTVLGGFSQGAVMAWAMGAAKGRPRPAGILAMSGFIPTVPDLEIDPGNLDGLPVMITHGEQDPIISIDFARDARDKAEAAGADVSYHETPVPHALDPSLTQELEEWVGARIAKPPSSF